MDDGMLGDAMTLQELGRQLLEMRQEVRAGFGAMGGNFTLLRGDVDLLRQDVNTLGREVATLGRAVATLDGRTAALEGRTAALEGRTAALEDRTTALTRKVTVGFEETHALLRFGLEAREALRETVDARFDALDRKHDEQIGLLKDVLRDVRRAG